MFFRVKGSLHPGCFISVRVQMLEQSIYNVRMREMEKFLLVLKNYRENKIIKYGDKARIFIWYMENIQKRNATIEIALPFLIQDFRSYSLGSDLSDDEIKSTIRKVKEYLIQAENRYKKTKGYDKS